MGYYYDNDYVRNSILSIIGAFVMIFVFIFVIGSCEMRPDEDVYNNGVCERCGGHYELIGGSGRGRHGGFVYECDNCQYVISTYNAMYPDYKG